MDEVDVAAERAEMLNETAIRAALSRVETTPSTGICKACSERIEAERLKANPNARYCHDCADEIESQAKLARRCGPR
jgi:RNA polymerase-binding transcription factor DksA